MAIDIRILRYFLAVAREQSITRASESLHIAQPTLSKQLMELEQELGKTLLIRGKRKVTLTEDGVRLRKRAEEIVNLMEKTQREITSDPQSISGEVSIGGKPTHTILNAATALRNRYADIQFHFFNSDAATLIEQLDHGGLDFAILLPPVDIQKYESICLPDVSQWGLLMESSSPLASAPHITREQLASVPLIVNQRTRLQREIALWAETEPEQLNIAATYNVLHGDPVALAKSGLGYVLAPREPLAAEPDNSCCFKPLRPPLELHYTLAWKRYSAFSRAAEAFLETVRSLAAEKSSIDKRF